VVIAAPPLLLGAPKLTMAAALPAVAETDVGGPGTVGDATLTETALEVAVYP
jgi:hypothetical protein